MDGVGTKVSAMETYKLTSKGRPATLGGGQATRLYDVMEELGGGRHDPWSTHPQFELRGRTRPLVAARPPSQQGLQRLRSPLPRQRVLHPAVGGLIGFPAAEGSKV
jgi:hypothetical protein